MTPQERKSLAEQIIANPLFHDILAAQEASALDGLVWAETEQDRVEAQWRVRSVRAFRSELNELLNTRERKGVPA